MFILGAMGPPGGGRTVISDRFLSCFNLINMTFPDETQVTRIFDTMLKQHVVNFDETVQRISKKNILLLHRKVIISYSVVQVKE